MRIEILTLLTAGAILASAKIIHLPLKSLTAEKSGGAPRGVTKWRHDLKNSTTAGVNIPVTDWFNRTDNQWYTTFSVGTPPQNFTALFDTGSPDFIVGSANCTTCGTKRLFDPSLSSTYRDSPGTFERYLFSTGADSIPFSENEGATGYLVSDTIAWGELVSENISFVICDTMAAALDVMPIDAIMGMSVPEDGYSWFWSLVGSGQLDSALYSFYIPGGDLSGGEVTVGGYDETKFEGDLQWIDCDADASEAFGAYIVDQLAIYADGVLLHNGTTATSASSSSSSSNTTSTVPMPAGLAILDTGTAFMQTPDYATAANLYAQISPAITLIDPAGAWGAPCEELDAAAPALTFTFGSGDDAAAAINVTIPAASFNLGEYPGLPGICQALFNNPSAGIGSAWFYGDEAEWLVGSPLLKQYYTVWDGQGLQIGWGKLADGPGF